MSYAGGMIGAGVGTVVLPGGGTIEGTVLGNIAGTALAYNIYDLASYYAAGYTDEDIEEAERGFVDGLDRTTVNSQVVIPEGYASYNGVILPEVPEEESRPNGFIFRDSSAGVYYFVYTNCFSISRYIRSGFYIFWASAASGVSGAYVTFKLDGDVWSVCASKSGISGSAIRIESGVPEVDLDGIWSSIDVYWSADVETVGGTVYLAASDPVYPGDESADSIPDSTSRISSLMQALNTYNIDNSYTDNSTNVNFFLAPSGETPTSDNVVSPAIYDEETLVFTEPATGAQYQTTGWTYDYTTRTYDITLDAGTYSIDGTDVTRIVSTYGDELATITYYDASGTALATDEYSYVMMSGSGCAIEGHSYTVETTKEASCIAAGERTYTCSVCGDQYVEEISKTDHVYADYTITQEPTCTVGGISSQTCSTCGSQITEKLDALGHDWIAKEVNETTYEVPEGTSCPDCSGTDYTYTRNGVIYTCICSDCSAEWTTEADVTYGNTTYVCSRCGESKVEVDATEETQETWFTKFIYKFKWLSSVGEIYRQLIADVTSDAATAAAIADGAVTLADVTSEHADADSETVTYTAPELAISFGDSDLYGVDWANIRPLDLSWYAPHKETVDGIVSGILWLSYLFLLIKRAPGIIRGSEMVTEDRIKIDAWNFRHGK